MDRNYFVKKGREWWDNLTDEEKQEKIEANRIAGKKGAESRWKKKRMHVS